MMPTPPLDFNGPAHLAYEALTEQDLTTGIYQLFDKRVTRQPDRIAVVDGDSAFTYAQLRVQVRQIARVIRTCTIPAGTPIGLWMDKSAGAIAALLAILAEGYPYVPLDLALPIHRNELIVAHAGVTLLIGYETDKSTAPTHLPFLGLEKVDDSGSTESYQPAGQPDHIAYILYTSGTTGRPKGIYQQQRGVLHDVLQYIDSVHLNALDRHSVLYSLSAIGSIRDVLGTLLTGGSLHLYHPAQQGLAGLALFIQAQQITVYHSLPLLFRGLLSVARGVYFPHVRLVYLAGDRIYRADVEKYRAYFSPTARLYVGIGSTENTTIYRQWFIDHHTPLTDELIPVGYAVPDRHMQLVDPAGREVVTGETGEIVVTSAYVALGYWQDKELTSASFMTNGDYRTFRTGDLGRLRADGLLEFIGRRDRQLKLSGYRVEPSEIEAVLLRTPGVLNAAVLLRTESGEGCLVAYIVAEKAVSIASLRSFATDYLPAYMVPVAWEFIDALPVLPTLKIDLNTLMEEDAVRCQQRTHFQPADLSQVEQTLRSAWCRYASTDSYEQDGSWRSGGGSSVNALLLLVELEEYVECELPTAWFHVDMHPGQLLAVLTDRLNAVTRTLPQSALFFAVFHPLYGMHEGSYQFIQELRKMGRVQVIQYPDLASQPLSTVSADTLLRYIKPQFAQLPTSVHIIGICSGCILAHEVVKWLEARTPLGGQVIYIDFPPAGTEFFWRVQLAHAIQRRSLKAVLLRLLRGLSLPFYHWLVVHHAQLTRRDPAPIVLKLLQRTTRQSFVKQPITVVQCADTGKVYPLQRAWSRLATEVNMIILSCDHNQMFRERGHLTHLATLLRRQLGCSD